MLAYDSTLAAVLTTLWYLVWIVWLGVMVRCLADVVRSSDLGAAGKGRWCVLLVAAPFVGVGCYLVARGNSMLQRDVDAAFAAEQSRAADAPDVAAPAVPREAMPFEEFLGRCAACHESLRHEGSTDVV